MSIQRIRKEPVERIYAELDGPGFAIKQGPLSAIVCEWCREKLPLRSGTLGNVAVIRCEAPKCVSRYKVAQQRRNLSVLLTHNGLLPHASHTVQIHVPPGMSESEIHDALLRLHEELGDSIQERSRKVERNAPWFRNPD